MCVVKDSPDAGLFRHPGALTKLALWIGEALAEQEREAGGGRLPHGGRGTPLVVAAPDDARGVYVVVGTGGGGGPDTAFLDREAARRRAREREERAKAREERRKVKEQIREQKREARRRMRREQKEGKEGGEGGAENEDDEEEEEEEETESEESSSDDDDDDDDDLGEEAEARVRQRGYGLNKFGTAFQDVVAETNARVRIDSFEHCVVEVKKEDLGAFLESLSMKAVVG